MAFLNDENRLEVSIPAASDRSGYTVYEISVHVGAVQWGVQHRYRDFEGLHQRLTTNHGIAKHLLPPKKIIGNKDPVFIQKRRIDLQAYLQGVVNLMQAAIVDELAEFLVLAQYEVLYLRQRLAAQHSTAMHDKQAHYTTLELHAISHGLHHAAPPHTTVTTARDFCHVAEAGTNIRTLTLHGSWDNYAESDIIPNELEYNFNLFKKVHTLNFDNCNVLKISNASNIRKTLHKLNVAKCGLVHLSDVLMCDTVHRDLELMDPDTLATIPKWAHLRDLNISYNKISSIDISISLCCKLETIDLSGNCLTGLNYLTKLPYLISVVVSNNAIVELPDLHTKLGNLVHLDLSRNKISSMAGLACLYSLVSLDVSCNLIVDVTEIRHIAKLPCLEDFILTGNPVSMIVDYRTKVLECFGSRCSQVCLDNERPTQRELDKVAVLQALRAARENKTLPTLNIASPLQLSRHSVTGGPPVTTTDLATAVEEATKLD